METGFEPKLALIMKAVLLCVYVELLVRLIILPYSLTIDFTNATGRIFVVQFLKRAITALIPLRFVTISYHDRMPRDPSFIMVEKYWSKSLTFNPPNGQKHVISNPKSLLSKGVAVLMTSSKLSVPYRL